MTKTKTPHIQIPEHVKLNDKEKEQILKKYNITKTNLPRILKDDPAIANLNLKKGDIVKIKRKLGTTGHTNFYRMVVNE